MYLVFKSGYVAVVSIVGLFHYADLFFKVVRAGLVTDDGEYRDVTI